MAAGVSDPTPHSAAAGDWVAANYDPEWIAGKCLAAGIGLHHARIPRALQHHAVQLNARGLAVPDLYFHPDRGREHLRPQRSRRGQCSKPAAVGLLHFSNIRGRAGRMFRHFIGRVYLFASSPEPTQTTVDIPIASQSRRATAATLLQRPEEELSEEAKARLAPYYEQDRLDIEVLRTNRGIDPDRQLAIAETIRDDSRAWHPRLAWAGVPTYNSVVAVAELILDHLVPAQQRGRVTPRSLATRLNVVRRAQGSVPDMVAAQLPFMQAETRRSKTFCSLIETGWVTSSLDR